MISDVLRFAQINFLRELRVLEGGFVGLFSVFVSDLILILISKLILILLKVEEARVPPPHSQFSIFAPIMNYEDKNSVYCSKKQSKAI